MGWKKTKFTSMNDSDDDSNRLQDLSPRPQGVPMANSSGKKRASNGSATDSQSVYAKVCWLQCRSFSSNTDIWILGFGLLCHSEELPFC